MDWITTKNNSEDRWKGHKSSIKYGKLYCPILGAAIKKYGEESFRPMNISNQN